MSRVSIRYAKAIFSLALEENKLDEVTRDLESIKSLMRENKDFNSFVINPLISRSQQVTIVKDLFVGKVQDLTSNFLQLICKKKRLNQLTEILNRFKELLMAHKNQVFAEVTSSDELDSAQLGEIKSNLESMTEKNILLSTRKDESLIGGFTVQVAGVIIDNSVQNQLIKLKEKLIS